MLQRSFQGASWTVCSASMASFFNWTPLLWLRQLQESLASADIHVWQDLNKIIAAVQFSKDTTLNSARFVAKSLASVVAACRLVWLCHWHADARHKWQLVSVPFAGSSCSGTV